MATKPVYGNGQMASRKGEYFRRELSVNNAGGPVWLGVTVTSPGEPTVTGNLFVPWTPEVFTHDLDGNLTSDGRWTYTWDLAHEIGGADGIVSRLRLGRCGTFGLAVGLISRAEENRLVQAESRSDVPSLSGRKVDWQYDALGRRIRQTTWNWLVQSNLWVVTEDLKFLSDPLLFGRHVVDLNASNNVPVRTYVWGLDLSETMDGAGGVGGLLWVTLHTASGSAAGTHFCAYDGNGNIVALSAASDGSATARYEYGPFGEPLRITGPAANQNPFRFSTKRTGSTSDLVLYEYRAYSSTLGRWLSTDRIDELGGSHLYGFVLNAPVKLVDADGRAIALGSPIAVLINVTVKATAAMAVCAAANAWLQTPQGKQTIHDIGVAANNRVGAIAGAAAEAEKRCSRCVRRPRGCLPCVPPVGTIMGQIDPNPGYGVNGPHVNLLLILQSPYPQWRCFHVRHFVAPIVGTTLPLGVMPVGPVAGGGAIP